MSRHGEDERARDINEIDQIADPITRSRAVAARSMQLLRASLPDTFLGRRRFEPFPEQGRQDGAQAPSVETSREISQQTSQDERQGKSQDE